MKKFIILFLSIFMTAFLFAQWGRLPSSSSSEEIGDSTAAARQDLRGDISDSIAVISEFDNIAIIDSFYIPQWVGSPLSGGSALLGMDSTTNELYLFTPGGKKKVYPQVAAGVGGQTIIDTLNYADRTVTKTWEWDGGNLIVADGQKLVVTDDAEDDSLVIEIKNDTAFIWVTGIALVMGEEGKTVVDSLLINDFIRFEDENTEIWEDASHNLTFKDANAGTKTLAELAIYDGVIFFNGMAIEEAFYSANNGSSATKYFGFSGIAGDSVVVDSMKILFYTAESDVYIDSIAVTDGIKKTGLSNTVLWGNGTDVLAGATNYSAQTYTDVNITLASDWRPTVYFAVATAGTAGSGRVYTWVFYAHYK